MYTKNVPFFLLIHNTPSSLGTALVAKFAALFATQYCHLYCRWASNTTRFIIDLCVLPMTSMFLPVAHHASACYVLVVGVIKPICVDSVQLPVDKMLCLTVFARSGLQSSCFLTCPLLHVHSLPNAASVTLFSLLARVLLHPI